MLQKWNSSGLVIIKRNHLIKDRGITCLADISGYAGNQPHWIIIEAGTDISVSFLSEWLILMICTTIRELGRSDINDSFTGTLRDQMYESENGTY